MLVDKDIPHVLPRSLPSVSLLHITYTPPHTLQALAWFLIMFPLIPTRSLHYYLDQRDETHGEQEHMEDRGGRCGTREEEDEREIQMTEEVEERGEGVPWWAHQHKEWHAGVRRAPSPSLVCPLFYFSNSSSCTPLPHDIRYTSYVVVSLNTICIFLNVCVITCMMACLLEYPASSILCIYASCVLCVSPASPASPAGPMRFLRLPCVFCACFALLPLTALYSAHPPLLFTHIMQGLTTEGGSNLMDGQEEEIDTQWTASSRNTWSCSE